ncbi:hypothetical protein QLH51_18790 [Sphingomonas sp. 2R-10]|uniref:hypothetical protein n=1 Tax=Sphingomonas sp. 2R-10 TaxID=3045148 RepID=UPI000F77E556|nr:hypothetical protein [Sphingomonas sp. 2R-10]MDJ0278844.1 hypothetical protein [Sphingomonas sp. 2R-10]
MPRRADRWLVVVGALALAGCGGDASDNAALVSDNAILPAPDATPTRVAPSPVPAAQVASTVPDRLTVTTNEPFYSVRVAPDVLVLTGVDMPTRRLAVLDREVRADTRRWRAGDLTVQVERKPCADDMSGAPRDFTATLTLNGQAIRGCGFTGTPAPPPGEQVAADVIPARFVGRWNRDAAACARPAASIEGVKVSPDELWFHESVGKVRRVEPLADGRIRITAAYDGEGQRWTSTQTLAVDGNRLTIITDGRPFTRLRCAD